MQTHRLDAVDLRILTALQVKGRATNVEIAEFANLTPPPTLRRIKTLEDHGIIRGYHAVLDARKLGYEVLAFIQIQLGSHTREHLRAFETLMRDSANVRECYALSGQRDFLLKCVFHNLPDAQQFVTDILLRTDNVLTATSSFGIRMTKNEPGVPLALVDAPTPLPAARKLRLPPIRQKRLSQL